MTDRTVPQGVRPRRPGWTPVIAGSLALFLALVLLLGVQMRAGRDPALGAGKPAAQVAPAPATVVRRIVTRRVVRVVHDRAPAARAATARAVAAPAPAPAASAPAPAPAAAATAPAPAPAPVVTRTS